MSRIRILSPLLLILIFSFPLMGQIKVISNEKVSIENPKQWSNPQFSPDGKSIFLTTPNYNGIWEYSIQNNSIKTITEDQGAGFGFNISEDGKEIVYRRTTYTNNSRERVQEIIQTGLSDNTSSVLDKGNDLSIPVIANKRVIYSIGTKTKNLLSALSINEIKVLGIENAKIAISKNGEKIILDPFGNGSYIWPSLSPDNENILAYEMDRGAFICNLKGEILSKLGKCDAPVWTRDGKWIIYMNVKDDGQNFTSSDIYCISPDGKTNIQLSNTNDKLEMFPACSLIENKIAYTTLNGELYILSYEEISK
jgi:Tol biopolymer transport system component